jgi:hypothetical protein
MADQTDSALQGAFASPFVTEIPPAVVMRLLSRYEREQLAGFIAVAIDLLDLGDGDTDVEGECSEDEISRCPDMGAQFLPGGPGCNISDGGDTAWIEWHNMRGSQKRGPNITGNPVGVFDEDEEDDDPAGQYDEDCYTGPAPKGEGAGCSIADPGGCEHDGREEEHDAEGEQMASDVPMLSVYSLEPNPFNGKRDYLGRSNMMSTFCVGFPGERSADTGKLHMGRMDLAKPGAPV